ncbi:MAG TPA: AMP-binding protein [Actinomycetota bacterium]|jgi:crotonobetaine/carnitine-CoA ligase|nr:AMP-binding protein [Actinomycetota bacterium]
MQRAVVVPDLLAERAKTDGDRLFVECDGVPRTFAEMQDRAERLAAGLTKLGVTKGDRVATILPNRIEHVELIFACARIGAIHVPVNVFLKGEFLRYQLADAAACVVVGDVAGLAAVEEIRGDLADLRHVVACDADLASDSGPPAVQITPGDTMAIIYTSGTTGMPKGCMLPYGYHSAGVRQVNTLLEYAPGDVLYTALPLFHGWARGMLFASLVHGLTIHLDAEFSPSATLQRLAETKATVFSGVGAMGMALLALPPSDADRAHSLRVAFMIPFAPQSEAEFTERFGARVQSQMYGQTETGAISFTPLNEEGKPGTIGRPSPQYDVRLADDGEVLVRAKHPDVLYTGYWNKPDETVEAVRDGWHHTGDLARMDDGGRLVFVDRKKDALRRRGENVSSVQLEAAIVGHPKIAEAAVVAVPSEMTEDDIKACVVLNPGEATTPGELFEFFKEKLPYFAVPRYVEIVESLPKTATMRVQKHMLRAARVSDATWDFDALGLVIDRDERR